MTGFLGFVGGVMQIGLFVLVIFGIAECDGQRQERYAIDTTEAIQECMEEGRELLGRDGKPLEGGELSAAHDWMLDNIFADGVMPNGWHYGPPAPYELCADARPTYSDDYSSDY